MTYFLNDHILGIFQVASMPAVKELLLETLDDLSYGELKKFKCLLQFTCFQKDLPHIWRQLHVGNSAELLVDLMVEMYGQQSVEVTREVFVYMNRTDLVQILSETSSGAKGKVKRTTVTLMCNDKYVLLWVKILSAAYSTK